MPDVMLTDLEYAVLKQLPLEGTQLGYIPNVKTVKHLAQVLNSGLPIGVPKITSPQLAASVRLLKHTGYAVAVRRGTHLLGWQATQAGKAIADQWKSPEFEEPAE